MKVGSGELKGKKLLLTIFFLRVREVTATSKNIIYF